MLMAMKHIHMSFALLSILGFLLRGFWMLRGSPLLQRKLTKILPHVVDTLLLASAITLLVLHGWNPLDQSWLMAKIIALLLYIVLGTIALKRGRTPQIRLLAFVAAVVTFAYIYATAVHRAPLFF